MFEDACSISAPEVVCDGFLSATFTYIPDHIEYLLFELIKNSMRFTAKHHNTCSSVFPPIRVTIGLDNSQVVFRISDQGGGIPKDIEENIFSWTHASQRNLERLQDVVHLSGKVNKDAYFSVIMSIPN